MILSAAILLLVITPIVLSIALSLPIVQNKIIDRAALFASQYMGVEIAIGNIDMTVTGRLEVKEFLARDFDGDTMIFVEHLTTRLLGFNALNKSLVLGGTEISGGAVNLLQSAETGAINIRDVTSIFVGEVPAKRPLQIMVSQVRIDDVDLTIRQLTPMNPEFGFDPRNIVIKSINGEVERLLIDGQSLNAQVNKLSAYEQCGMRVDEISGAFYLTSGALSITDMRLRSPNSDLGIRYLGLADATWSNYSDFNTSTTLEVDISSGYISSNDVKYFAPSMRNWDMVLKNIDLTAKGSVHNLDVNIYSLSYRDSDVAGRLLLQGLPMVESTVVDMELTHFITSATDIESFMIDIDSRNAQSPLTAEQTRVLNELGKVQVSGVAKGSMSDVSMQATVETDKGWAKGDAELKMLDGGAVSLSGDVEGEGLNVGALAGRKEFGEATFSTSFDGVLSGASSVMALKSSIPSFVVKGYELRNSSFVAKLDNGTLDATVESYDPNINITLEGHVERLLSDVEGAPFHPSFGATMDIRNMEFTKLGLNRRDSISRFASHIKMMGDVSSIENARLSVNMLDGEYISQRDTITTKGALLTINSEEHSRELDLTSDFLDLSLRSKSSVKEMIDYLRGAIYPYLPVMYNRVISSGDDVVMSQEDDYTTVHLKAHKISTITNAITQGLTIGDGAELDLRFNPVAKLFAASFHAPYIEHGSLLALGAQVEVSNTAEQVNVRSSVEEFFIGVEPLYNSFADASIRNNSIDLKCGFDNPEDGNSLSINTLSTIRYKSPQQIAQQGSRGWRREVNVDLLPSSFTRFNQPWDVSGRSIMVDGDGFKVDKFILSSGEQSLKIDGIASGRDDESLDIEMNDFNLSIFSPILSQFGYEAKGVSNGVIKAKSLLNKRLIEADVALDSVRLNNIQAPAMRLNAQWDSKGNQARLYLTNRESRDTLMRGYYIPSQVKYFARLTMDEFDVGMIDAPLSGVIKDTKGLASIDATIIGERREADLNGSIKIKAMASTVAYTNCRYIIPSADITMANNMLSCRGVEVMDSKGNKGELRLDLNLQHLSNINYSLAMKSNKMMVLNTTEDDNDLFYGEMYGSGLVTIEGAKGNVKMDVMMSTDDNSHFYMPLSHKSNIQAVDFITFVKPTAEQSTLSQLRDMLLKDRKRKYDTSTNNLEVNMTLDVRSNTEAQIVIDPKVGDVIKTTGEGRLNLTINPQRNIFDIYGDYNIHEGSYLFTLQNIVNKRFVIDPGSTIQWVGDPADAILNINAIYKLKTSLQPLLADESTRAVPVDCIINLSDRLTHPQVTFAIELPSSDAEQQAAVDNLLNDQETVSRQFFYLMLANSFISESQSAGSANLASSTTAATGFELLTNQLSNWLSTSSYNVMIRYRPESEMAGDEVDFGFSKGLVGNRLLVELEGNYILDNKQAVSEDASNFMGEAYITWLIDRAGGVKVKGFTQTIDSYDENQGLQETGVGLYYSESFNNFKDLRERVRSRFTASPARQESRRRRKQAKKSARIERREERKRLKNNNK